LDRSRILRGVVSVLTARRSERRIIRRITLKTLDPVLRPLVAFYADILASNGPTPLGVGWNSMDAQQVRFAQVCEVLKGVGKHSIIDYGCGYGALLPYLRSLGGDFDYWGYDMCGSMIEAAKVQFGGEPNTHFTTERAELPRADYCLASGIFSFKLDADDRAWRDYMIDTIEDMASLATRGVAFNALTTYSDPEKRRPELYYADPLHLFDYCKRNISRDVALLHDYELFDFTIVVRMS
jgi:SAM-dependent methyltransferase